MYLLRFQVGNIADENFSSVSLFYHLFILLVHPAVLKFCNMLPANCKASY